MEGSPFHLARFANEIPRRSATEWVLVISCLSIGSCVVKFGRFQHLSSPANRAAESPRRDSSSIELSHVPAPQTCVPAEAVRRTRVQRPRNKWPDRLSCSKDVLYGREQLTKHNKAGGNSFAPVRMILDMPGRATPLVKSRASPAICRKLNRILCFHDAHGFSEIGFVRRVLPISPVPLNSSACFSTPSGQLKGTSDRASQAAMPETYWAHTWHTWQVLARAKYAEYAVGRRNNPSNSPFLPDRNNRSRPGCSLNPRVCNFRHVRIVAACHWVRSAEIANQSS